jgi:hypothetical protein
MGRPPKVKEVPAEEKVLDVLDNQNVLAIQEVLETPVNQESQEDQEEFELLDPSLIKVSPNDQRGRGLGLAVNVDGIRGRIIIYSAAFREMLNGADKVKIEFVKLVTYPKYPNRMWIIPVYDKTAYGARGLHLSGNTIRVSCKGLMADLNRSKTPASQHPVKWDKINKGLVVYLDQSA